MSIIKAINPSTNYSSVVFEESSDRSAFPTDAQGLPILELDFSALPTPAVDQALPGTRFLIPDRSGYDPRLLTVIDLAANNNGTISKQQIESQGLNLRRGGKKSDALTAATMVQGFSVACQNTPDCDLEPLIVLSRTQKCHFNVPLAPGEIYSLGLKTKPDECTSPAELFGVDTDDWTSNGEWRNSKGKIRPSVDATIEILRKTGNTLTDPASLLNFIRLAEKNGDSSWGTSSQHYFRNFKLHANGSVCCTNIGGQVNYYLPGMPVRYNFCFTTNDIKRLGEDVCRKLASPEGLPADEAVQHLSMLTGNRTVKKAQTNNPAVKARKAARSTTGRGRKSTRQPRRASRSASPHRESAETLYNLSTVPIIYAESPESRTIEIDSMQYNLLPPNRVSTGTKNNTAILMRDIPAFSAFEVTNKSWLDTAKNAAQPTGDVRLIEGWIDPVDCSTKNILICANPISAKSAVVLNSEFNIRIHSPIMMESQPIALPECESLLDCNIFGDIPLPIAQPCVSEPQEVDFVDGEAWTDFLQPDFFSGILIQ